MEKTGYTQRTVLAVISGIETAMLCATAERKEAGMLRSSPTLRLRSSNPLHLAGESFHAQEEKSFLPLWLNEKDPKIKQAQWSRGADTRGSAIP